MVSILIGIFGALFGAYINNIFTWKIRSRVDALDTVSKNMFEILKYFSPKLKSEKHNITEKDNYGFIIGEITVLNATVLYDEFDIYITDLWNITEKISKSNDYQSDETKKDLEVFKKVFNIFFDKIIKKRTEYTSFRYMFKQLFVNWGTLVTILLVVIAYLLFNCFNISHLTPVVHIVEMYSN